MAKSKVERPSSSISETVARRVAKRVRCGSILILIAVIGLILQLVQFWMDNCKERNPKKVGPRMRRLTFIQRAAIRNKARELCASHTEVSVRDMANEICDAMFAEELSEDEAVAIAAESLNPFAE